MKRSATMLLILSIGPLRAGAAEYPMKALERFKSAAPISAKVSLQRWEEKTLRKKTSQTQGTISIDVTQNARGLQTNLEPQYLEQAARESLSSEPGSESEMPIRTLLKDLDYGRIHHLLDQEEVLRGLISNGKFVQERSETWRGQAVRTFEYTFKPRLSLEESYHLSHSEGHLIFRTTPDGVPLQSEIKVAFEGRTSRMFGRYLGSKSTGTLYKVVAGHLIVSERSVEDFSSKEDGSDITKTKRVFSVNID